MKKILLSLLLAISAMTNANYKAGVDYIMFDKPVRTVTGNKVEVRELFWYYCPHCFDFEPLVQNWLKKMPNSARFVQQPAVFSDRWVSGAIFYYVLEQLGEIERLHQALFNAIHVEKKIFINSDNFIEWLVERGVGKTKAKNAFSSFSVHVKVNQSKINTSRYKGLSSVPSFIVAGKYLVDIENTGRNESRVFDVINHLIKKESKVE